jgi:catechol 2,3-dioxygenase-like lactoylglutathione lyase family enzyme
MSWNTVHARYGVEMFGLVAIGASDRDASARFYETVLAPLGVGWCEFSVVDAAASGRSVTRGLHLGFVAPSDAHVDAFWRAGVDAGYRDDGPPGPRPQYADDYYGGFLLDPDGNSAEAVHDGAPRQGGAIDHLWIRVADLAASTGFYDQLGPGAGFTRVFTADNRARFAGTSGSFTVVTGDRVTEGLRMALPATDPADVGRHLTDPDGNVVELV